MERAEQKFDRLLGALDDLVAQEAATLAQRDFPAVESIQRRAEPLVAALAALGPTAATVPARARVETLLARRQNSIEFLETELAAARAELSLVEESAGRVARIAPVYGRAEGSPTSLGGFRAEV
jgi:flagellar biosynthesis/type III secretory pathway chaperone